MRRAAAWLRDAAGVRSLWTLAVPFGMVTLWAVAVDLLRAAGH